MFQYAQVFPMCQSVLIYVSVSMCLSVPMCQNIPKYSSFLICKSIPICQAFQYVKCSNMSKFSKVCKWTGCPNDPMCPSVPMYIARMCGGIHMCQSIPFH